MGFRKAEEKDIKAITAIYNAVHEAEEQGKLTIGWETGIYPVTATAESAVSRGDLYLYEENGKVLASAIINQIQVDCYAGAKWQYNIPDDKIMVLHTLVVSPDAAGKGIGTCFVHFYEDFARSHGALYLRMDTNAINKRARALYKRLGYTEADIVPTVFNGIAGVNLVLLEKKLECTSMDMIFRRAKPEDMRDIMKMQMEIFHGEQDIPADEVEDFIEKNPICWCAEIGGKICGAAAAWKEEEKMHWGRFAVLPEMRGQHIGTRLAEYSINDIFDDGADTVYMEARDITVNIVCKMGGEIIGEPVAFFKGNVTPVVLKKSKFSAKV